MMRYLAIRSPAQTNAQGLVDCLGEALVHIHLDLNYKEGVLKVEGVPTLAGEGTDGASNSVVVGMKMLMQSNFPWDWCFSHRLELACKDACKSSLK